MTRRIKLTIEYDGSNYCGWQIQPQKRTVQGEIESALETLARKKVRLHASGRTDAGVHALGQVAHFDISANIPSEKYANALNSLLPSDISIKASEEVPENFHARYSATRKIYRYRVYIGDRRPALDRKKCMWLLEKPDINLLEKATEKIIGTHDFTSFTSAERKERGNVRTIYRADWSIEGDYFIFEIEGSGFLYKMVRILVGTLLEVGGGKIECDDIEKILDKKDRAASGETSPSHGLYLVRVIY